MAQATGSGRLNFCFVCLFFKGNLSELDRFSCRKIIKVEMKVRSLHTRCAIGPLCSPGLRLTPAQQSSSTSPGPNRSATRSTDKLDRAAERAAGADRGGVRRTTGGADGDSPRAAAAAAVRDGIPPNCS